MVKNRRKLYCNCNPNSKKEEEKKKKGILQRIWCFFFGCNCH